MATVTSDWSEVSISTEHSRGTARSRAPLEVRVVLYEAAGNEQLVLPSNLARESLSIVRATYSTA